MNKNKWLKVVNSGKTSSVKKNTTRSPPHFYKENYKSATQLDSDSSDNISSHYVALILGPQLGSNEGSTDDSHVRSSFMPWHCTTN